MLPNGNSSQTRKIWSEGAQIVLVLKSTDIPNCGDFLGFFKEKLPNTSIGRQNEANTTWTS